MVSSISHSLCW